MAGTGGSKYRLRTIRRFRAHTGGNEDHVCGAILAGPDWDHLVLCGTVTMTEAEWGTLARLLAEGLGADVQLEDVVTAI